MNDADRRALDKLFLDIGFSDDDYRLLGNCTAVGMAALLLSDDESALEAWYEHRGDVDAPIARMLERAVDRPEVAQHIDTHLEGDPGILADLVRAGILWAHPALIELLDRPAFRLPAAWMSCQSNPELFTGWLLDERAPDEVVDVARGAALAGAVEHFEVLAEWRDAIEEVGAPWDARLDAALFVLSPERWGRRYLRGDWEADVFTDSVAMADALTAGGWSYWAESLALWEDHPVEFAFIARLALAGVAASLAQANEANFDALVEEFDGERWDALAARPSFAVANALIPEKDQALTELMLESAAHDLLTTRHVASPGIRGLPLSSSHPSNEQFEWAAEWLGNVPAELENAFDVVATLVDLAELHARGDDRIEPVLDVARDLREHGHDVVARAADRVFELGSIDQLVAEADDESVSGFVAIERLARHGEAALEPLTRLWANGPPTRATSYADALFEELRFLHSRQES